MSKILTNKLTRLNSYIQNIILKIIYFFYTPFKRFIPEQIFRYGMAGCSNMVFDWLLYFIFYNFIFCHNIVYIGAIAISAHIASFIFTFPITFISGFWLSKYISFKGSEIKSTTQLFRYLFVVGMCILINYICLKFFVEICGIFPTPSKMITTIITTIFSYLMQKYFTFKA